jgi:CDP-diacylglycerol--glycerol-3-phosphate 3-phosphatidyltransferase
MRREAPYFIAAIASTVLPPIIGYCKFRTGTSYHTWAAKLAAFSLGTSVLLLFAGWPPYLFRLATPVIVYAALEEIAITLVLPESQSNVRSLWHIVRLRVDRRNRVS